MDFERICMLFTMQEPYYGILLSSMERVPDKNIGTLAVARFGNVFKLLYNPDFVNKFSTDTVIELIRHEVLHVAFCHFTIWGDDDRFDTEAMHRMRNMAADLEINGYLNRSVMDKEAGGLWCEDMGLDKFLGTKEYFRILLDKQKQEEQQKQQAQAPQKPCNGGQGGDSHNQNQQITQPGKPEGDNGQTEQQPSQNPQDTQPDNPVNELCDSLKELEGRSFDDHSKWPDEMDDTEKEMIQQVVEDLLVQAEEETLKACGNVPSEMKILLDRIKSKKPRPAADWKRYFRRYLGNEFTEFIRKSKKRESRRFPDAPGNKHRRKSRIMVAIDTSGSVSMPEYNEFFGQIKTLREHADFHVVECDSRIQYEYDFKGVIPQTLHGHGGTDFSPVTALYNSKRKDYDALVYFTDGYCNIPKDTPKETIWVISSNGDQSDRKKYKVNGASVAFIKKKQ